MEIEGLSSLQNDRNVNWRGVMNFLESVRAGQPINYVTPFLPKDKRDDEQAYAQELLPMALTDLPELNDVEEGEAKKFGPFSIRLPWDERRKTVANYFEQVEVKASISLMKATRKVQQLLPAHRLRSLDLDKSYQVAPKGKNLGLPLFTNDRSKGEEYLARAKHIAKFGYKDDSYPAMLGWRGQPNGTRSPKQRAVWMFDHAETYIGEGVIKVALDALKTKPGFAAWNDLTVVDKAITGIIDRARAKILSVDFSQYDASLPETPIHLAFECLRYWFVSADKARIDWVERQFLQTMLLTPDGLYTGRRGGVPSGDSSTNFIDSLAQIIIAEAAAIDLGFSLIAIEVLGDDGVYLPDRDLDIDAVSSYYEDLYGMKVSADKGGYSLDEVKFLSRLHLRRYRVHGICVGIRSIMRTLNGVMHLERLHRRLPPVFYSARLVMQVENSKWHPNFKQLVLWCYEHDRFLRMYDPAVIFEKSGGTEKVEEVLRLRSFKFGAELPTHGLDKFETVIELRRLRGENRAA